ncbi:3-keto-disaccharide hydrolase [Colwellia sp. RE-S-Sl-9]
MKKIYLSICCISASFLASAEKKIDPKLTEQWTPIPEIVTPSPVPSDAIVLFDGKSTENLEHGDGSKVKWKVENGNLTIEPGTKGIFSKEKFCDIQLHIEWKSPEKIAGKAGQKLGNSGLFIQSRYEVQILDSYENQTYANGQAGSVYKQSAPLVNAMKPTGEWQTYDIIYHAPKFTEKELSKPADITVLHNGVLIQDHFILKGGTVYRGQPKYRAHGCDRLLLQDHNDKVSFRNIWVRKL